MKRIILVGLMVIGLLVIVTGCTCEQNMIVRNANKENVEKILNEFVTIQKLTIVSTNKEEGLYQIEDQVEFSNSATNSNYSGYISIKIYQNNKDVIMEVIAAKQDLDFAFPYSYIDKFKEILEDKYGYKVELKALYAQ